MVTESNTHQVTAEDCMTPMVHVIHPHLTLREAIQLLVSHRISGAPIVDSTEKVMSVLSEGDALRLAASRGLDTVISTCLDELVPTNKLIVTKKTELLVNIYRKFLQHPVHRIFVTDSVGKILGILSRSDVLNAVIQKQ